MSTWIRVKHLTKIEKSERKSNTCSNTFSVLYIEYSVQLPMSFPEFTTAYTHVAYNVCPRFFFSRNNPDNAVFIYFYLLINNMLFVYLLNIRDRNKSGSKIHALMQMALSPSFFFFLFFLTVGRTSRRDKLCKLSHDSDNVVAS